jgi:hypothetical protein
LKPPQSKGSKGDPPFDGKIRDSDDILVDQLKDILVGSPQQIIRAIRHNKG